MAVIDPATTDAEIERLTQAGMRGVRFRMLEPPELPWDVLETEERFAEMIDWHWDGVAHYCKPENKDSLGFVKGLNNKLPVTQRRAYGLRD